MAAINSSYNPWAFATTNYLMYQKSHKEDFGAPFRAPSNSSTESREHAEKNLQKEYATDKNGFFDAEFNRAAGIPEDIKIHSKIVDKIRRYPDDTGNETSIEKIVSNLWKMFSDVTNGDVDSDRNGFLSKDEYKNMPAGYRMTEEDGITSAYTYKDFPQIQRKNENNYKAYGFAVGPTFRSGTVNAQIEDEMSKTHSSFESIYGALYPDEARGDEVALGAAFGIFMKASMTFITRETLDNISNYENMLQGKGSFMADFIEELQKKLIEDMADELKENPEGNNEKRDTNLDMLPSFALDAKKKVISYGVMETNAVSSINTKA